MEKKKKHQKLVTPSAQEPGSNDLLGKEDQNKSNEAHAAKNTRTGSPSEEYLSSLNEQYPHFLQRTYSNSQHAEEQTSLNPRPFAPSRWQQVTPLQPNSPNHLVQQGQPTMHLAQSSTTPFWLQPQRPSFHFPAVNVPAATFQPFTSITTADGSWQPPIIVGGTTSRSQKEVPICYSYGPYPGLPGHWDPSSLWAHGLQSQPSFNCTLQGAYGFFSSAPPPMPNCSTTFGESSQRGIIRPTAKLSQKHQQLWEAQSLENVQLWNVIGQLQSEIADYKSRLMKLEAQVSFLRPSADEPQPAAQVIQPGISGPASKRGRPKRSVAVSASPDQSNPRARARKPAASKAQNEARVLDFENVALSNLEDGEKTVRPNHGIQKDNGEKIPFVITNTSSVNLGLNGSNLPMPASNSQVHQEGRRVQIVGIDGNSSLEMRSNGDKHDSKPALSILSQQPKENRKGSSLTNIGGTNGETLTWPISQTNFYGDGYVTRQAGNPGWSFVNENSDELEDAVAGSTKDENEEEMGDDASSGAEEETAQTKDQRAYNMSNTVGTNPEDLPPYNWS